MTGLEEMESGERNLLWFLLTYFGIGLLAATRCWVQEKQKWRQQTLPVTQTDVIGSIGNCLWEFAFWPATLIDLWLEWVAARARAEQKKEKEHGSE